MNSEFVNSENWLALLICPQQCSKARWLSEIVRNDPEEIRFEWERWPQMKER